MATSSKTELTNFHTDANSSKYVVNRVHAPISDTLATDQSDRAVGSMNLQQYCPFPTLQQSHNGLPTNSQKNDVTSSNDAGHADTQVPSDLPIYHLFKMTLEMRVGNNAQHDHNILNHCGPEKQERTMNATHNGLDKVSKVTKEKYLASIGGTLCTACNLTPDRKKGISAQSGRVKIDTAKPQKHLKAIVQLNVTADSVKTGVKLACENAFRGVKDRGQY